MWTTSDMNKNGFELDSIWTNSGLELHSALIKTVLNGNKTQNKTGNHTNNADLNELRKAHGLNRVSTSRNKLDLFISTKRFVVNVDS